MADAWGGSWGTSWGLSWSGEAAPVVIERPDTHDGGGKREDELDFITEEQLRKLLKLDEDDTPEEIEEIAEEIEEVAREVEATQTYLPQAPSIEIIAAALKEARALRTAVKAEALTHYRESAQRLRKAIDDQEEAEIMQIVALLQ